MSTKGDEEERGMQVCGRWEDLAEKVELKLSFVRRASRLGLTREFLQHQNCRKIKFKADSSLSCKKVQNQAHFCSRKR